MIRTLTLLLLARLVIFQPCIEGHHAMCGDQRFHIVDFSIGCLPPVIWHAIPTSDTLFRVADWHCQTVCEPPVRSVSERCGVGAWGASCVGNAAPDG